jgi:hypothetical protein
MTEFRPALDIAAPTSALDEIVGISNVPPYSGLAAVGGG